MNHRQRFWFRYSSLLLFAILVVPLAAPGHPAASAAGRAPTAVQTRVFQQDRDGYSGVLDTWVSAHDWDTPPQHTVNYGQNEGLELSRDGRDNPLRGCSASRPPIRVST